MQYDQKKIHPRVNTRKVYVWSDFASDQGGGVLSCSKAIEGMDGWLLSLAFQPTAPKPNLLKKNGCHQCGRAPP